VTRHRARLATLAAALCVAGAAADAPPRAAAPRAVVEPAVFDFGAARQDRTLSTQFTIRNHGDAVLVLGPIASDCSCAAAWLGASRVEPGASTALRVSLQTRKARGALQRKVLVRTNDPKQTQLELRVRADVKVGE
jgi:hypothetical protein